MTYFVRTVWHISWEVHSIKLTFFSKIYNCQSDFAGGSLAIYQVTAFIATVRRKFHSDRFFPRASSFWNRSRWGCYQDHYNLKPFNRYAYYIFSWSTILTSVKQRQRLVLYSMSNNEKKKKNSTYNSNTTHAPKNKILLRNLRMIIIPLFILIFFSFLFEFLGWSVIIYTIYIGLLSYIFVVITNFDRWELRPSFRSYGTMA